MNYVLQQLAGHLYSQLHRKFLVLGVGGFAEAESKLELGRHELVMNSPVRSSTLLSPGFYTAFPGDMSALPIAQHTQTHEVINHTRLDSG